MAGLAQLQTNDLVTQSTEKKRANISISGREAAFSPNSYWERRSGEQPNISDVSLSDLPASRRVFLSSTPTIFWRKTWRAALSAASSAARFSD
jgi:hypothetical protein